MGCLGIHFESVTGVLLGLFDDLRLLVLPPSFLLRFLLILLLGENSFRVVFLKLLAKLVDLLPASLMLTVLSVLPPISLKSSIEVILLDAVIYVPDNLLKRIHLSRFEPVVFHKFFLLCQHLLLPLHPNRSNWV